MFPPPPGRRLVGCLVNRDDPDAEPNDSVVFDTSKSHINDPIITVQYVDFVLVCSLTNNYRGQFLPQESSSVAQSERSVLQGVMDRQHHRQWEVSQS